jgi:lysophospholipase L1-like esterase
MRASVAVAVAVAGLALSVPSPAAAGRRHYYVSLGDSLAVGVQPDGPPPYNETDFGYTNQLLTILRRQQPALVHQGFGCGGESTVSLIGGSQFPDVAASCGPPGFYSARYPQGTQLASALHFLRTHPGEVELVTIDVGSNDVGGCVATADAACVEAALPGLAERLTTILHALRRAGAPLIVGMTYYDPLLGAWLAGPDGQAFAQASNDNVQRLNAVLTRVYRRAGARVADVAGSFHITDFTPTAGGLPRNVAHACARTWFCTPPPLGPDVHANTDGYAVIARAFAAQLGRRWS